MADMKFCPRCTDVKLEHTIGDLRTKLTCRLIKTNFRSITYNNIKVILWLKNHGIAFL
jgi:hypothetical protein